MACSLLIVAAVPAQAQLADLVVNQADSPDPGPAGGVFTYTIRIDNNGPSDATGVTLTNTLPPGSTFVGVSATQGSCTLGGGSANCALGDIAFLANVTVTLQVELPTAGVWTNTATAGATTADPNTSNNLNVTEDTTAQAAADMSVTVVDAPDPLAAGQNNNYTVTARNNGPDALTASDTHSISFTVPAGVCIRNVPTGTGWSCVPAIGYPLCSGSIACTRSAALGVGVNAPALTVPAVANVSGSISTAFQVSASRPDGDTANNTATATTTVTGGSSNVSITKTRSAASVAVGSNITYTITPRFNGGEPPGTLPPNVITVTDTLNAGLTFVSASGTGWTCVFSAPTLTCTRPGPYTGGTFTNMPVITLVAQVNVVGTIPNTATITAPETDPELANNNSNVNVTGTNTTDLSLTKISSRNPVATGVAFNYTLTVRNNGVAVPAGNTITVTDSLPAGIELTAAPSGTGWTCMPNAGFPIAGPVTITCTRAGPLATNTNAPGITVPVRATAAGTLVNNACVALTGSTLTDGTAGNNCGAVSLSATSGQADLQLVSKTASPNPVPSGQDLTYVITVRNNSVDAATNVTLTDTLASLVTTGGFQSAVPSQGTCTPSGVTPGPSVALSCNLGTLAGGAVATVTVVVRPFRATTGNRANEAIVASPDIGDPTPANNRIEIASVVTAGADVAVTKTATPSPVMAGTPLTYIVTARNNGPSTAQNVTISDPVPPGTAFVQLLSVTGAGTCTVPAAGATSGAVNCSWASIASAAQQTATFVVRPLTSSTGGTIDNTVSIATTTVDNMPGNNSFLISTPVAPAQVDILVNKVDSVDPVAIGQSTMYTVTVTNGGPAFATNVVLTDTFPAGSPTATFSYQGSLTLAPSGVGSCVEPAHGATSGTLTCTFPGLASGASAIVTYSMRAETIASGVSGTTFNAASVTADEPETIAANNATVHATTSRRTADLAVAKSGLASFTPGLPFTWTIDVGNLGPNDSMGAMLTDPLPPGVTFVSATPGCVHSGGTVTCTLGTIASGGSTSIAIVVLPASPYTGSNPLQNTATVTAVNEIDPVSSNDSGTSSVNAGPPSTDLSLVKSGPASVPPGAAIAWQLVIANAGPSSADGATFVDTVPAGVTGVTAACGTPTGGAICGPVNVAPGSVSGSITVLPAGGGVTITINATAPLTGPLVNNAQVSAPPGSVDPVPGNNTGSTTTAIPLPDLTVVKVANGTFTQGQVGATYTLTVSNAGVGTTVAPASVSDTLPTGLTATAIAGSGWSCTMATLTCTRSDALAPSASYPPITLTVDVAFNAPASVVNGATVGGGGETNTANNTSTVTTPVTPVFPDLTIVKVATGTFTQGQVGVTYTLTATNAGAAPTSGLVTVTDVPPTGLTATAIAGTGWSCVLAPLTCTRSDSLAPSASYPPITLTVTVGSNAPSSVVNLATISGGGETNTSNNTSTTTTPVTTSLADLTIVKVANGTFTQGHVGATYTLTVTNAGAGSTSGLVTVTDTLPVGLTATAIAGTGWSCVLATLTCTRSDGLAPSASYSPITLIVNVAANAPANLVNIATVTGGGETNAANNTTAASSALGPTASGPVEVPTLSTFGVVALILLVLLASYAVYRRRAVEP